MMTPADQKGKEREKKLREALKVAEEALLGLEFFIEEDRNTCITPAYKEAIDKFDKALAKIREVKK